MPEIIGVKELYKNLNKIYERTAKGESFVVVKRSKPMFEINPYRKREQQLSKTSLWEDFKDLQFSSLRDGKQDRNLSEKIDEVVYGLK